MHPNIGAEVSCYYLVAERVLIDPMEPEEGLDWFRENGAARAHPPVEPPPLPRQREVRRGVRLQGPCEPPGHARVLRRPAGRAVRLRRRTARRRRRPTRPARSAPTTPRFHIPAHSALAVADGVINYGGLGFVPEEHLGDDIEATKRAIRDSYATAARGRVRQPAGGPRRAGRRRRARRSCASSPRASASRPRRRCGCRPRPRDRAVEDVGVELDRRLSARPHGDQARRAVDPLQRRAHAPRSGRPRVADAARHLVGRDRAHDRLAVPLADTAHARRRRRRRRPGAASRRSCPGNLLRMPPVEVAAARCPSASSATAPIVSPAACHCGSRVLRDVPAGSTRSTPSRSAIASAPAPASSTCGVFSITARARTIGLRMPRIAATPPARRGRPAHDRGVVLGLAEFVQHRAAARR